MEFIVSVGVSLVMLLVTCTVIYTFVAAWIKDGRRLVVEGRQITRKERRMIDEVRAQRPDKSEAEVLAIYDSIVAEDKRKREAVVGVLVLGTGTLVIFAAIGFILAAIFPPIVLLIAGLWMLFK